MKQCRKDDAGIAVDRVLQEGGEIVVEGSSSQGGRYKEPVHSILEFMRPRFTQEERRPTLHNLATKELFL